MDPLRGQYGFLSVFGGITEQEAKRRVRDMLTLDIKEYEFYNACGGYSAPPPRSEKSWDGPLGEATNKNVILAYNEEITSSGGRSWLHVQMQATDPGDAALQSGATLLGQWKVPGEPLLDLVVPNAAWAKKNAPRWAAFAKSLGFQGIHWSTFGNFREAADKGADTYGFLRASLEELAKHGLGQTCSFIDGFGWDERIHTENLVAFNYWIVRDTPNSEDMLFESRMAPFHGVYAAWPGKSAAHTNETWNAHVVGMSPFEVLTSRWLKAKHHNSSYLAVGDGFRRLQTDFYPESVPLTDEEVEIIRTNITCQPSCGSTTSTTTGPGTSTTTGPGCDGRETDTQMGELQITPDGNDVLHDIAALKSRKAALEEMIRKSRRGACWVEIREFVPATGTDGTQVVKVKFQLRFQAVLGPNDPKVMGAGPISLRQSVEPPDSSTPPGRPGAWILAALLAVLGCCTAAVCLRSACKRSSRELRKYIISLQYPPPLAYVPAGLPSAAAGDLVD